MRISAPLSLLMLFVALLFGTSVAAQDGDIDLGIIDAQAGDWLVAKEDGSPGCIIRLLKEQTIGGFGVEGAEKCSGSVSGIADAAAWNFNDGGVILIDPLRKVLIRFIENEGSPLRTDEPEGQAIDLVPAIDGVDSLPVAATIKGAWIMKRPSGEILCTIVLGDTRSEDGNYSLTIEKDCDPVVKKLDFSVWNASGVGIVLMSSDGKSLSFVSTKAGFDKDPIEGGKPLLLVRP